MNSRTSIIQNRSEDIPKNQLFFLSVWIWSLTFGIDLFYELKLFDIIAFFGIFFVFRGHILPENWRNNNLTKWSVRFLICGLYGVFVTFIRYSDPSWMLVVILRYYRFVCYIVLSLIIRNLLISQPSLKRLLDVIFFSILVQAILIALQYLGFMPILWPGYELHEHDFYTGTLGLNHINSVAFMIIGIAAAFGGINWYFLKRKNIINILLLLFSIAFMIFSMLVGEARSSILALSTFSVSIIKRMRGIFIILGILLAIIVISKIAHIDIIERGMHVFDYRLTRKIQVVEGQSPLSIESVARDRTRIWKTTIYYLINYPGNLIFGTGFQNFKNLSRNYKTQLPNTVFGDRPQNSSSAHNLFLHVLAELGIIGFVVLFKWLISIWQSIRVWNRQDKILYYSLTYPGLACFISLLSLAMVNECFYPHRNVPGFLGFFMAYISVITHNGWLRSSQPTQINNTR